MKKRNQRQNFRLKVCKKAKAGSGITYSNEKIAFRSEMWYNTDVLSKLKIEYGGGLSERNFKRSFKGTASRSFF